MAKGDKTIVVEGNHYLPLDSVNRDYLQESSTHNTCPWKGLASYYSIGAAALEMTEARRSVSLADGERTAILGGMLTLPPHPEVPESLARLRAAGLRLATLTNSTAAVAEAQLTNAGLIDFFDQVLSVDAVQRFKPATDPYRVAARELGVATSDLRLVAADDWDVAGALRAGWAAAFVARPGMVLGPLSERPDIAGRDLREVVDQILEG